MSDTTQSFSVPSSDLVPELESSADYARMTAALSYLSENWSEHPDLAEVSNAAGLSPHHFQRVFTRWVRPGGTVKGDSTIIAHTHLTLAWQACSSSPHLSCGTFLLKRTLMA